MSLLGVLGTIVGGVGAIGGAVLLVAAFRAGQVQDSARERRLFRSAVAAIVVGTATFVAVLVASAH